MITTLITIMVVNILLIGIGMVANSIMDTIKFKYENSILPRIKNKVIKHWFHPRSWKLKWKYVDGEMVPLEKAPWYYLGIHNPGHKEKFPFSSTMLVGFTNAWHFFQFIMFTCFELTFLIPMSIFTYMFTPLNKWETLLLTLLVFIFIKLYKGAVFELFWNRLLVYKK